MQKVNSLEKEKNSTMEQRHSFQVEVKNGYQSLLPPEKVCERGWSTVNDDISCLHFVFINQSQRVEFGIEAYENACKQHNLLPYALPYTSFIKFQRYSGEFTNNIIVVTQLQDESNFKNSMCAAYLHTDNLVVSSSFQQGKHCFTHGNFPGAFSCEQCKMSVICMSRKIPLLQHIHQQKLYYTNVKMVLLYQKLKCAMVSMTVSTKMMSSPVFIYISHMLQLASPFYNPDASIL